MEEIRSTAFLSSTKVDQTHVYLTNVWSRQGVCLVCKWLFLSGAVGLKVRVEGGCCVATTSQIASRESGMLFESLWTQFSPSILLCANLHNDTNLCYNVLASSPTSYVLYWQNCFVSVSGAGRRRLFSILAVFGWGLCYFSRYVMEFEWDWMITLPLCQNGAKSRLTRHWTDSWWYSETLAFIRRLENVVNVKECNATYFST